MKRFFLIAMVLSVLGLSACASMMNTQSQKVTIRTPGATGAKCTLQNEDMRYVAYTDETIEIMHSPHDLTVRCTAPGNREKTVQIEKDVHPMIIANAANGILPGTAYDYFSRGAFIYPNEFVISFLDKPVTSYPKPAYHAPDLEHNNEYNSAEYMGPTIVLTEETRNQTPGELQKRKNPYGSTDYTVTNNHNATNIYDPTEEDK